MAPQRQQGDTRPAKAVNRAVSLSRAGRYFCLEIMKKRFCHGVRVIGIFFAFAVAIEFVTFAIAAEKNEAWIIQAIHNVPLLAPNALSSSV